ncbi:unnamed protein product [Periconia digitata]|uniref:Telomeric single stranded DNA binding POT1/Cdc13 domain-containing protein n=1 Tax=Periconia digitata TaxID=1303443 RepID=A0A9W4U9C9_9PLEO|nr:unnamed protein product [Periconia digitata]
MEYTPIAELRPELPGLESQQCRAVVTLIWPYSSSARQFALLLADPNIRLRRNNGQVRARFFGSSARAMASTGVGIGDEVVLSLRGASFVREDTVSTPGKSIDYELEYTQTVALQISRHGTELATLDLVDVAPTPAIRSPVRPTPHKPALSAIEEPGRWSSPAFLKRARLSQGPVFEAGYDPFTDDIEDEHARKRRRKSYRDWSAWKYSNRTPSPEKEERSSEDLDDVYTSPTRPTKLPRTPVSPLKPDQPSHKTSPSEQNQVIGLCNDDEKEHEDTGRGTNEDRIEHRTNLDPDARTEAKNDKTKTLSDQLADSGFVRNNDDYDLYVDPSGSPPYASQPISQYPSVDGSVQDSQRVEILLDEVDDVPDVIADEDQGEQNEQATEYIDIPLPMHSHVEEPLGIGPGMATQTGPNIEWHGDSQNLLALDDNFPIVMAPPTLPMLQTDFSTTLAPGMLTPIGKEPQSPSLRPLDSSTLPMPSPFPDERDEANTSYLEHVDHSQSATQTPTKQKHVAQDADSGETSFYSSVSSSKAPVFHESAFTDVRFTFGFDGSALSSLVPAGQTEISEDVQIQPETVDEIPKTLQEYSLVEAGGTDLAAMDEDISFAEVDDETTNVNLVAQPTPEKQNIQPITAISSEDSEHVEALGKTQSKFRRVLKDSASDGSAVDGENDDSEANAEESVSVHEHDFLDSNDPETQIHFAEESTIIPGTDSREPPAPAPAAVSEVIDIGSDSSDEGYEEDHKEPQPLTADSQSITPASQIQTYPAEGGSKGENPDIKMESIERDSAFDLEGYEATQQETGPRKSVGLADDPPEEMLIEIPEGDRVDENHVVSVPATAPASNTRSKTKLMSSPARGEISVHKGTPQASKARYSLESISRTTRSPSATRSTLATSPTPVSSYNLRSHSTQHSPASVNVTESRPVSSHRQTTQQRSVETRDDEDGMTSSQSSTYKELKSPALNFMPSQSLGASRGKYSNTAFAKDSEESSSHSAKYLPTARYSDDPTGNQDTSSELEDPKGNEPRASPATMKTEPESHANSALVSSPSDVRTSSASKSFARAASSMSSTPRRSRRLRKDAYDLPMDDDELSDASTPKQATRNPSAAQKTPRDRRKGDPSSSFSVSSVTEEATISSPKPPQFAPVPNQSISENPLLATPEASQLPPGSPSFPSAQRDSVLPITPQLTQANYAGLRSFKTSDEPLQVDSDTVEVAHSPKPKRTPHRNIVSTGSPPRTASPSAKSDVETEVTLAPKPNPPSIGLSTPIAYYTPLKDIHYFLNRSSNFHSSSSPDVFALVTSDTTAPKRADKGPKDYFTTFQITDISLFPTTTTVQVFRPYDTALPYAQKGDIVLLRSFPVKSLNRRPTLVSGDDSAWCVWRYGKMLWGTSRAAFAEIRAREEVNGPSVERAEGEWKEVEKMRAWYLGSVKAELEESGVKTRSRDKA